MDDQRTAEEKYTLEYIQRNKGGVNIDHDDPSKPSHRLTNGPEPSKTIESDGRKIKKPSKNH